VVVLVCVDYIGRAVVVVEAEATNREILQNKKIKCLSRARRAKKEMLFCFINKYKTKPKCPSFEFPRQIYHT
jgi:hypothetical protein